MSRTFYSYAIFLTAFAILVMLSQSAIYLLIGRAMLELASTRQWVFASFVPVTISSLVLIRYLHYQKCQFAYWAGVATVVISFCHMVALNRFLVTREATPFYVSVSVLMMIVGLVFGGSLAFSRAREKKWLRIAGLSSFALGLLWVGTLIWALNSVTAFVDGTAEQVDQWISLGNSIIPVFIMLNFLDERRAAGISQPEGSLETLMGLALFVVLITGSIFGTRFITDGFWRYRNPDFVWDGVRKMAQPFDEGYYASGETDTLHYRLLKPVDYDSTKNYPIVVCLHGSSGCGHDNMKQISACLPARWLLEEENRAKYPAFLLVPQCPLRKTWGGLDGAPSVDQQVIETLLSLEKTLPIDTTRRYITGNSLGGYGTWHLIAKYPDVFAAALPISGGGDPALAHRMKDVPIWTFHGTDDINVPVKKTQQMIKAIKNAGGNPIYTEFQGKAHNIEQDILATPGVLDWLFTQQKNGISPPDPNPRGLFYE